MIAPSPFVFLVYIHTVLSCALHPLLLCLSCTSTLPCHVQGTLSCCVSRIHPHCAVMCRVPMQSACVSRVHPHCSVMCRVPCPVVFLVYIHTVLSCAGYPITLCFSCTSALFCHVHCTLSFCVSRAHPHCSVMSIAPSPFVFVVYIHTVLSCPLHPLLLCFSCTSTLFCHVHCTLSFCVSRVHPHCSVMCIAPSPFVFLVYICTVLSCPGYPVLRTSVL